MDKKIYYSLIGLLSGIVIQINFGTIFYFAYLVILSILVLNFCSKSERFLIIGSLLLLLSLFLSPKDYDYKIGQEIYISGEVTRANPKYENYQRIEVKTKDKGKFSIATSGDEKYNLYDIVSGTIVIKDIGGYYNFNLLNRKDYFFLKNINGNSNAISLERSENPSIVKNYKLRLIKNVNSIIDENFSIKNRGIIKKLVLAESRDLDESVNELYQEGGLSHLLAISGLHILIIITILELALKSINIQYNWRFVVIILLLSIYAFVLDYPPSVNRAILMYSLKKIASINKIKVSNNSIIFLSAIILLTINPRWLYDLGFQLSFMSVLGISILKDRLFSDQKSELANGISLYLSVNIFIFPLLAYNFNNFNILSLITNLFMTPIVTFVLIMSYIGLLIESIFGVGGILFGILDFILEGSEFYLEYILNTIDFKIAIPYPDVRFVLFYYFMLYIFLKRPMANLFYRNRKTIYLMFAFIIISLSLNLNSNPLYVGFLDVGQGDSSYLIYKDKYIQIDTGGSVFSSYNPGEEVTAKSIIKRGVKQVDILILSHFDADHISGIPKLLEENLVGNILLNRPESSDPVYNEIIKSGVNVFYVSSDNALDLDKNLSLEFYNTNPDPYIESNDSSLVVLVKYKDKKILFTGDSSSQVEDSLIEKIGGVDILKVSHHGSEYSTSEEFAYGMSPKYAIISSGKNNSYGHPSKKVLNNLEKIGCNILRTDTEGEIIFKIDSDIKFKTYFNDNGFGIDLVNSIFSVIIISGSFYYIKKNEEIYEIQRL